MTALVLYANADNLALIHLLSEAAKQQGSKTESSAVVYVVQTQGVCHSLVQELAELAHHDLKAGSKSLW